jgi:peptide/nickel transport system permease protein
MRRYIIRRLYQTVIVIFAVVTILFVLFRLLPGNPAEFVLDQTIDELTRQRLLVEWGLDAPLYQQYFTYLRNLLQLNFGVSFYYRKPIWDALHTTLWNTIVLMGTGMSIALSMGVLIGAYAGWRRGSRLERFGLVLALVLRSMPIFWLGIIFLMIFTYWLSLFPTGGIRSTGYSASNLLQTYFSLNFLHHMALPLLVAVLHYLPNPLMVMRTSMLEIRGEDFLKFAESLGLSETALMRHCAKNAILPVVTFAALMAGFALGGQVILEYIFAWPGMGREMLLAIERRDYPVAQGSFIIMSTLVICVNFVVDILYSYLDPRIKYA